MVPASCVVELAARTLVAPGEYRWRRLAPPPPDRSRPAHEDGVLAASAVGGSADWDLVRTAFVARA